MTIDIVDQDWPAQPFVPSSLQVDVIHCMDALTMLRRLPDQSINCDCNAGVRPGIVLDPFMGSGTSGLVARANGRSYIGSELNPEYVAICRERLRQPFEDHHIVKETRIDDLPLFQMKES